MFIEALSKVDKYSARRIRCGPISRITKYLTGPPTYGIINI